MNNQITIYTANALTSKDHKTLGNPAAVVISDDLYDAELMKNISVYAKQPMTSFLVPDANQYNTYTLRYYDLLGQETHICGHATVAATQVLIDNGQAQAGDEITFHLNPDLFEGQATSVTTSIDENNNIAITMPASQLEERNNDPVLLETVAKALRIDADHIDSISFSTNIRDFVVGIKDPYILETLEPDFEFMKQMAAEGDYSHEGLMVSALSDDDQWDLKVRVFLPITGVNEDIACGSGNCSIIPFWYEKGMKQDDPTFKSVFTFPTDPDNLGGIQEVSLDPKAQKVTIKSQATSGNSFFFNLSKQLKKTMKSSKNETNIVKENKGDIEVYRIKGKLPGPKFLIFGAIHGNELCGAFAMHRLLDEVKNQQLSVSSGELILVPIANPEAYPDKRFSEINLNTIFKENNAPKTKEEIYAQDLRELIQETDYFLDIHSFRAQGHPFIFEDYEDQETKDFISNIGMEKTVVGWLNLNHDEGRYEPTQCAREFNKISALIECGMNSDPNSANIAYRSILNASRYLGIIDGNVIKPEFQDRYVVEKSFLRKDYDEVLSQDWQNFDVVPTGTVITEHTNGNPHIVAEKETVILFPCGTSEPDTEWLLLGTPAPKF